MRRLIIIVCVLGSAALAPGAGPEARSPVNAMCPVGKEPIVASAGTVEHGGATIGLCCPSCGRQFLAWSQGRRDEFVALARAGREPGRAAPEGPAASEPGAPKKEWADLYSLDTCPISGAKLGSMGDAVVKEYGGREVRFCCAPCIPKFEAAPEASWRRVDEAMVKDQLRYYPLDRCVVSGKPLSEGGKETALSLVYRNRLVRLCGRDCEREFMAEPRRFMAKLDDAAAEAQRKDYPMTTCVVAGSRLGSMGEPTERVVAGRLLRFCCASCEPKVGADPAKYLRAIDEAWRAKGRFLPAAEAGR